MTRKKEASLTKKIICSTILLVVVLGLISGAILWVNRSLPFPPEAKRAIAAAKAEARRRGWKRFEIVNPIFENGVWVMIVEGRPTVPGDHAIVTVSPEGRVLEFSPGL